MATGAFKVQKDPKDPTIIYFSPEAGVDPVPDDQIDLKSQAESTLASLKIIFEKNSERFEEYYDSLFSLAKLGLEGSDARPQIALRALQTLQDEILTRDGTRIKNSYMKTLGITAFLLGIGPLCFVLIISFKNILIPKMLILWVGCMVGTWLSFGMRRTSLKFEDLQVIQEDKLGPGIRLVFSGVLTLVFGLMLYKEILEIKMGVFSTKMISSDSIVALLIGVFSGISEKALPSKISEQAGKFFKS